MMTKKQDFAGKRVLLTGAASGIGRACALELAHRGAQLALVDIDETALETTVAEIRNLGAAVTPIVADLAFPQGVESAAAAALEALGQIDVLFSNAGVAVVKPLPTTTPADWQWIFAVNLWAAIGLSRALIPTMAARGGGQIVATASLAGLVGAPGMLPYSTTKFALVGFLEALRHDVADMGIDVTIVCPGYVPTNLHNATRYDNAGFARFMTAPPTWLAVSPTQAARTIVDGIARRAPWVVFGIEKLGWWLKRISPTAQFRLTRWLARHYELVAPPKSAAPLSRRSEQRA
jgi:NAD(P)-dependent dehydrogenase (short-subunit alcohol dehydrogenase family)